MPKLGTEFELLVKGIYEEVLEQDGFETISVSHDVRIPGKSGQAHQIDVYWEFKVAGISHRVAVECKEYKSTVSVGKIRDFHGALCDIGNIKGIFVTTKGYQKGAIKFAEFVNIDLKTVHEPSQTELDELPGINTIHINGRAICLGKSQMHPLFDMEWIKANTSFKTGDSYSFQGRNDEVLLVNSEGLRIDSILDLENKLPRGDTAANGLEHIFDFDDSYLFVPESTTKSLKLRSIKFTYDIYTIDVSNVIRIKMMAKAILKDILSGEYFLHKSKTNIE